MTPPIASLVTQGREDLIPAVVCDLCYCHHRHVNSGAVRISAPAPTIAVGGDRLATATSNRRQTDQRVPFDGVHIPRIATAPREHVDQRECDYHE